MPGLNIAECHLEWISINGNNCSASQALLQTHRTSNTSEVIRLCFSNLWYIELHWVYDASSEIILKSTLDIVPSKEKAPENLSFKTHL